MNRWLLIVTATLLAGSACRDASAPSGASGVVTTSAPTTTTPTTTTTILTPPPPSPPTSSTSVPSNRPPSVRISGDESCHPRRRGDVVDPCTVSFRAEATDPDGDPLRYRWSGCASGEDASAACVIDALETVTATVEVADGRGGSVRASKTAEGTNRPPKLGTFFCGYVPSQNPGAPDCGTAICAPPIPINGIGQCSDGNFDHFDEEGDGERCGPVIPSGVCHEPGGVFECGGIEDAYSFEFRTGNDEGDCTFEIFVSDDWGATGSTTVRVSVHGYP